MADSANSPVSAARGICLSICWCIAASVSGQICAAQTEADFNTQSDQTIIEEIIVTAQRREQNLQAVPMTVDVLSGLELAELRINDLTAVGQYVPNVDVKNAFGAVMPLISIRGVGLQDITLINNPAVGVYVDDVYLASTGLLDFAIFDVERVEVLKGPQGTLYGRNTTGGAIKVLPRRPEPGFAAMARLDVGDYVLREFEGVLGGGSETLAGRLSVFSRRQGEGFVTNRVTGRMLGEVAIDAVRGQVSWQANEQLSLRLSAQGGRNRSDAASFEHISLLDPVTFDICGPILQGRVDPFNCVDIMGYTDTDLDPFTGDYNLEPVIDNASWGASLHVNWLTDRLELVSITGFADFDRFQQDQTDANPFVQGEALYDADLEQFSQEFRLSTIEGETVKWVAGVYYSNDSIVGQPDVVLFLDDILFTRIRINLDQRTESRAVFGQVDWRFASQWNLTVGLRYTDEERDYDAANIDTNPFGTSCLLPPFDCNPGMTGPVVNGSTETRIENDDWSGTIGVDYSPSDDWLLFARFSNGFKSGGFDAGAFLQEQFEPFGPESVNAWEAGFKSTLSGGAVALNGAVFYYDFDDMQLFAVEEIGGLPITRLTNAGKSEMSGLDLSLRWRASEGLDVRGSLGYLDTELVEFVTDGGMDLSGNELPQSPRWSGRLGVRYEHSVGNGLTWAVSGDLSHSDHNFTDIVNTPYLAQEASTLFDARIGLSARDGAWNLSLWGRNLTDEKYVASAGEGRPLVSFRAWGARRTWGVSMSYRW